MSESILTPPGFCEYASGPCDQDFSGLDAIEALFIYPSDPPFIASTLKEAVSQLRGHGSPTAWKTWEDLSISGQIVFCEICKAMRSARIVVANLTTLNFNVLFELGYAVGLGRPVLPLRDVTYERDQALYEEVGLFATLGYTRFSNSSEIVATVNREKSAARPVVAKQPRINHQQPIYLLKSPVETDGSIRLQSGLKKSYFGFRAFDPKEMPRLSLHEAFQQVLSSVAVIAHLMDPDRTGATAHNARSAFACGLALAAGKHVLMLQEGVVTQPIDYRELVIPYEDPGIITYNIERIVRSTAETIQQVGPTPGSSARGLLERIDLGDVAAENEIQTLGSYFVKTPQFQQARQAHARLVVGRKGSGKTALFYGLREDIRTKRGYEELLILDLKPEGHQFRRLKETVIQPLSEGMRQHTLTAFWHYLLLVEIANKTLSRRAQRAYTDAEALSHFNQLRELYEKHESMEGEGDFSERLLGLVERVIESFPEPSQKLRAPDITDALYRGDIGELETVTLDFLDDADGIWILFDNIDKGFPAHGLDNVDVLIVRCLLEASRKLQRSLERHDLVCHTTVFLRRDVYDHLVDQTPDRGKEPSVTVDWSDVRLIEELLLLRMRFEVPELRSEFNEVWSQLFETHVGGESSFGYIIARTFLRPRDVLNFVRKCIHVAVSRGHERVTEEDILHAEEEFSEDMLNELRFEIRDVFPGQQDVLLEFMNTSTRLSKDDVDLVLMESKVADEDLKKTLSTLLWYSFLGVSDGVKDHFSYQHSYSVQRVNALRKTANSNSQVFVVHPAFYRALGVEGT